jgi:hypothetical protein
MNTALIARKELRVERLPGLRSWLVAIIFSVGSFVGTLAALNSPVEGATVRPTPLGKPLERSFATAPVNTEPKPVIQSTAAAPPMIQLASEPAGAFVRDARGNAIGSTPLRLNVGTAVVITHDGYRDKHVSLALREQSVLVVLAKNVPAPHRKRARR